jgi:hypothetical protein
MLGFCALRVGAVSEHTSPSSATRPRESLQDEESLCYLSRFDPRSSIRLDDSERVEFIRDVIGSNKRHHYFFGE